MAVVKSKDAVLDIGAVVAGDSVLKELFPRNVAAVVDGIRDRLDAVSPSAFADFVSGRFFPRKGLSTVVLGVDEGEADVVLRKVAERVNRYCMDTEDGVRFPRKHKLGDGADVVAPVERLEGVTVRLEGKPYQCVQGASPIDNWMVSPAGERVLSLGSEGYPQKLSLDGHDFVVLTIPDPVSEKNTFAVFGHEGERILNFDSGHSEMVDGKASLVYHSPASGKPEVVSGDSLRQYADNLLALKTQETRNWRRQYLEGVDFVSRNILGEKARRGVKHSL